MTHFCVIDGRRGKGQRSFKEDNIIFTREEGSLNLSHHSSLLMEWKCSTFSLLLLMAIFTCLCQVSVTAEKRIIRKGWSQAARGPCRHPERGSRTCLGMLQNLKRAGRKMQPAFNRVKKLIQAKRLTSCRRKVKMLIKNQLKEAYINDTNLYKIV